MEYEKGFNLPCNILSSSHVFFPSISGLVDKAWPNFIYPGPKLIKTFESFFPISF